MEIYFDNSATTRADDQVIEVVEQVMQEDYGNPSSKHRKGMDSEKYLRQARETLARILKVSEKEIIFTSGGTESNNLALIGAALANQRAGKHIISTCFEHSSVLEPLKMLEQYVCPDGETFSVTYLPVDGDGHISLQELKQAIRPDTILVTTMFVNNEIGAVQQIAQIGKLIKEANPRCLYHVDAIQAFGKYEIYPEKMRIDLLSVSSHKFHGPKGVGFLYKKEKVKLTPLMLGGGQQKGMRSGTDNVPGIAGMARAAALAYENLPQARAYLEMLKDRLIDGLTQYADEVAASSSASSPASSPAGLSSNSSVELSAGSSAGLSASPSDKVSVGLSTSLTTGKNVRSPGHHASFYIRINSQKKEASAPHIVSATFYPVKSEVLLHALEDKGIYVSSGSACSSNRPGLSGTLQAIGLTPKEADCTLRFSFCKYNTIEEVDYALEQVRQCYEVLKRFTAH